MTARPVIALGARRLDGGVPVKLGNLGAPDPEALCPVLTRVFSEDLFPVPALRSALAQSSTGPVVVADRAARVTVDLGRPAATDASEILGYLDRAGGDRVSVTLGIDAWV